MEEYNDVIHMDPVYSMPALLLRYAMYWVLTKHASRAIHLLDCIVSWHPAIPCSKQTKTFDDHKESVHMLRGSFVARGGVAAYLESYAKSVQLRFNPGYGYTRSTMKRSR